MKTMEKNAGERNINKVIQELEMCLTVTFE